MMEEKQNGKTDFKRLKDLAMVRHHHERAERNQQCNKNRPECTWLNHQHRTRSCFDLFLCADYVPDEKIWL